MKKLSIEWTRHLPDDKSKTDLEMAVRNSTVAIRRLQEILRGYEAELTSKEVTEDYDSPAWAYKQADLNGQRRTIKKLLNLLSFV